LGKPDESQKSEPTQFPSQSQLTIGDSLYKGIRVLVSFSGQQAVVEGEAVDQVINSQDDEQYQAVSHPLSL